MRFRDIFKKALITTLGVSASMIFAVTTMAEDSPRDEYEEWQKARREEQREMLEYQRNPTRENYREWQDARLDTQREHAEYQAALRSGRYVGNVRYGNFNQESPRDEYEEWQSAVREMRNEEMEYRRNPTRDNYRGWQDAIRDERREYAEYQASLRNNRRGGYDGGYIVSYPNTSRNTGSYRINMNGSYYNVDNQGYSILRDAVNRGYQQGYNAGLNDRRYGRTSNYYNNSVYMSGTFGYSSYVARNQYQHYFQQGFQRGYEDGFKSQTRYGYRTGNTYNILGGVLNTILNIANRVDN